MYCYQCGAEIGKGKKFCTRCGANLRPMDSPEPEPIPLPANPPRPRYGLMALDVAIAYCALFMPFVKASFLPVSVTLLDLAKGAENLASLSSLMGSSGSSETNALNILTGFAWFLVVAVVATVALDLYRDYKGGGNARSAFVGLAVAVIEFFFDAVVSSQISSSLAGFGVGSVSSSVVKCGTGVWLVGILGIVSIFMHVRNYAVRAAHGIEGDGSHVLP